MAFAALAAFFAFSVTRAGPGAPTVMTGAYVAAVTLPLCAVDLRERRLPDALVVPGFVYGAVMLGYRALARGSPVWPALGLCAGALAVFAALAVAGGLGMGDVKLAGMLALTLGAGGFGAGAAVVGMCVAFVTAGLVALAGLIDALRTGDRSSSEIPFGPFLLAGFWIAVAVG
ncbi:MAG TPA: prepilin peptidase [Leifsonia sp.]|nr:prepilin peptidase [Leifsonia sp.]